MLFSILIWYLETFTVIFISKALNVNISLKVTIIAASLTFLTMVVPITPAGFGTYEFTMSATISALQPTIHIQEASLIALLDHIFRQIYVYITGGFSFLRLRLNLNEIELEQPKNENKERIKSSK